MSLFEQAMASQNHNIGRIAEQMGLSMQQLVEMLKDKDKGKEQPSMIPATSTTTTCSSWCNREVRHSDTTLTIPTRATSSSSYYSRPSSDCT